MQIVSKWDGRISVERAQRSRRYKSYNSKEHSREDRRTRVKGEPRATHYHARFDHYTMLAAQVLADRVEENGQISNLMMVHDAYQEALDRQVSKMPNGSFYQEAS